MILRGSLVILSRPTRASRPAFGGHLSMTRGRVEGRSHIRMTLSLGVTLRCVAQQRLER
jgi:hypothetical protein